MLFRSHTCECTCTTDSCCHWNIHYTPSGALCLIWSTSVAIHCAPVGGITDSHSPHRAIMRYHKLKMEEINKIIRELWMKTYKGGGEQLVTRWIAAASGRDCMWPPPPALGVCLPLVWRYSAPSFPDTGSILSRHWGYSAPSFPDTGSILSRHWGYSAPSFPGTGEQLVCAVGYAWSHEYGVTGSLDCLHTKWSMT